MHVSQLIQDDRTVDKYLTPTYYSPIMASDRIQRRIEHLLDQIEQEADLQNWQRVRDLAGEALEFAPDNADATTFLEVAERILAAVAEPQFPNPSSQVVATPQPSSFASGATRR